MGHGGAGERLSILAISGCTTVCRNKKRRCYKGYASSYAATEPSMGSDATSRSNKQQNAACRVYK
jgi:hypothetical protein